MLRARRGSDNEVPARYERGLSRAQLKAPFAARPQSQPCLSVTEILADYRPLSTPRGDPCGGCARALTVPTPVGTPFGEDILLALTASTPVGTPIREG